MKENNIEILSDVQHVLSRAGLYLGDTSPGNHERWILENNKLVHKNIKYVPAFMKLVDEIISNSIDEAIRTNFKFANKISIDVNRLTGEISILDNGRGLPIKPNKQIPDKTDAELAFTQMRAGTNFSDDEAVSIGTNGMGSTLVNVWSTYFNVITCDGKKSMQLTTNDNFSMEAYSVKFGKSKEHKTQVTFIPDYDRLNMSIVDDVHFRLIEKRVTDLALCFPNIQFSFNNKEIKSSTFKSYLNLINDEYQSLVTPNFKCAILPSENEQVISFVNGIDVFRGGSHVDLARSLLVSELQKKIKGKYKFDIKPSDIRNKINFVLIIDSIKTPKFDSQTKERITTNSKEYGDMFKSIIDPSFINSIMKNIDIITPIIETHRLKQEVAERTALKKASKSVSKQRIANHIVAASKERERCTIFITEGLCLSNDTNIICLSNDNTIINKKISELGYDDKVLTHKHNFKNLKGISSVLKESLKIKFGSDEIICSEKHKFLIYDKSKRLFEWICAIDIDIKIHQFVRNKVTYCENLNQIQAIIENDSNGYSIIYNKYDFDVSENHEIIVFDTLANSFKSKTVKNISIEFDLLIT